MLTYYIRRYVLHPDHSMAGCAAPELADLYVCGRRVMPN